MSNDLQYIRLVRKANGSVKYTDAKRIVSMIESENGEDGLKDMTEEMFLKKAYEYHNSGLHRKDPFCSFCLRTFQNWNERNNHVKMIHLEVKEGKFNCQLCEKSFMSKSALKYHSDTKHPAENYDIKCLVCGARYSHEISLKRHLKIHDETITLHRCNECQKEFHRKDILNKHMKNVHKKVPYDVKMVKLFQIENEAYKCKICNKIYSGENADRELSSHLINKCSRKQFKCSQCDRDFSSKTNLKHHEKKCSH